MPNKSEKYKEFFDTAHLTKDLKGKSVRGGVWTMIGQVGSYVIKLASTMVLARILTPEDYGLIAMAAVLTNFALMFKDMGLSMATVQRATITHEQVSVLFWINLGVSILVGFILVSLAPAVVMFYGDPRLMNIILVLSIIFPFSGLIIQHQAILQRQMKFRALSYIQIFSVVFGIIVALVAAFYGLGYWSLVLMQIASPIAMMPLIWYFCRWVPSLPRRKTGVRGMLKFGANITGFNFINYFSRNLDKLLIGKFGSPAELGNYSKAYQLLMLPISQIRGPMLKVATPVLSRLQNDEIKYCNYYYRLINILSFITMPMMVFLAVCSRDVVLVFLGKQWLGMCSIFSILAIASFIQPVASTRGLVLISLGQSRRYLLWGIANAVVVIIAFCIGIKWMSRGIAISYCIANYFILIPSLWYCFKDSPLSISGFFIKISGPAIASLVSGLAVYFVMNSQIMSGQLVLFRVMINLFFCILAYLAVLFVVPVWRKDVLGLMELVRHIRG